MVTYIRRHFRPGKLLRRACRGTRQRIRRGARAVARIIVCGSESRIVPCDFEPCETVPRNMDAEASFFPNNDNTLRFHDDRHYADAPCGTEERVAAAVVEFLGCNDRSLASILGFEDEAGIMQERGLRSSGTNAAGTSGGAALNEAAGAGNLNIVKQLLARDADLNYKNRNGRTALNAAARNGHIDVVKFLLKRCSCINSQDENGNTALIAAAMRGYFKIVEMILESGFRVDVDVRNYYDDTALNLAAMSGYMNVVELLLQRGADLHYVWNDRALVYAAENGHNEIIMMLLELGADFSFRERRLIPIGAMTRRPEIPEWM